MPNFNINLSRFQLLVGPSLTLLEAAIPAHDSDYHCRKFSSHTHVLLTLFAQLAGVESANAIVEELNDLGHSPHERNLHEVVGFDFEDAVTQQPVTLNQSSFSRANRERSYRLWRYLFHKLWARVSPHCQPKQLLGLGQIVAVDGSLFDCLPRMVWALYHKDCPKVKGHFFFNLNGLPHKLVLTTGKGSERDVLRQNFQAHTTYIFDRGYNDYELFAQLRKLDSHFVTRLLSNAQLTVVCDNPLSPAQSERGIVSDRTIRFSNDHADQLYRVIEYQHSSGQIWRYVTSRSDVEASTIVELYEWRWQIERFFWWLKTHLQVRHWYSECENGVLIQLYAALIAFLLLKLFALHSGEPEFLRMGISLVRWVRRHLFDKVSTAQIRAYLSLVGFGGESDSS